jgi:hypothetical protein
MFEHQDLPLTPRQQGRLRKAREKGYLDARCRENEALVQAYGLWCWRLKVPMVLAERRSKYSRYARVYLEMFTSGMRLSSDGQSAMRAICAPSNRADGTMVSPHDACWDHVALPNAVDVARTVYRMAVRAGNYELNESRPALAVVKRQAKVIQMDASRMALA